jgi:hypothetical protein
MMKDIPSNLKVRVLLAQALFGILIFYYWMSRRIGLDIETISWLENFLADYENIVLIVSHDRHFLDAVCTHVADVDRQKIKIFTGNYTFWYESFTIRWPARSGIRIKKPKRNVKALIGFHCTISLPMHQKVNRRLQEKRH